MTDSHSKNEIAQAPEAGGDTRELSPAMKREFERAVRSRKRVRMLKVVLPLIGGLIVLGGIGVTVIARAIPDDVRISGASIEDGRVVMDDPRMSGVDSNDRPFELVAQKAMQAITGGAIDLEGIDAKVAVSDKTNAVIRASAGHYDPNDQLLNLTGGMSIKTDDGLQVEMQSAGIDLTAGTLTTEEPVHIKTADQEIRANGMSLSDNGDKIRFSGGVSMKLNPASADMMSRKTKTEDPRLAEAAPIETGDQ
ncbi:LPS export ABC transporter periplasmic protein LptC [Fulvimarina sp. MAC8]|uniref:LPS export ABC transporter periplasmic protein LptC n=1 Tax=Fulvimarina sp. MAC8 TaxID=3162874 RepID=UPI0032F009FA